MEVGKGGCLAQEHVYSHAKVKKTLGSSALPPAVCERCLQFPP